MGVGAQLCFAGGVECLGVFISEALSDPDCEVDAVEWRGGGAGGGAGGGGGGGWGGGAVDGAGRGGRSVAGGGGRESASDCGPHGRGAGDFGSALREVSWGGED